MSEDSGVSGVDQFAAVYDRHRSKIYAQCLRRLRSHADADDATQVTFLRAFAAIERGNGPRLVGPWLATIARNVCADRLSDPRQAVPVDVSELTLVDDGPDIDAGLVSEADSAEVRAALMHLPFTQRSVLHLREVEELSYAQVADRLSVPVTTVETLLFRARANLRDELGAVRAPLRCDRARELSRAVREGLSVTSIERKGLRNHRSDCALCSWLPVRRARGLTGARAAAVLVATAAAAAARRLIATPVADAMAAAGAPAKTAAVALTAGSLAAGGLAAEKQVHVSGPMPQSHAAVRKHPSAVTPQRVTPRSVPARTNPTAQRRAPVLRTAATRTSAAPSATIRDEAARNRRPDPRHVEQEDRERTQDDSRGKRGRADAPDRADGPKSREAEHPRKQESPAQPLMRSDRAPAGASDREEAEPAPSLRTTG